MGHAFHHRAFASLILDLLFLNLPNSFDVSFSSEDGCFTAMDNLEYSPHVAKLQDANCLAQLGVEFLFLLKDFIQMWRSVFLVLGFTFNQVQKNVFFDIFISQNHCCFSLSSELIHNVFDDVSVQSFLTVIVETEVKKNTFDFLELQDVFSGLLLLLCLVSELLDLVGVLLEVLGFGALQLSGSITLK